MAREVIQNLSLTTDIMVGFPNETDDEFDNSYDFCRRIGYSGIHVFPYSPRPGTGAARVVDNIEDKEKKRRVSLMLALADQCSRRFRERFIGQTMNVLWEMQKVGTY
jgi:threonylcarbamoyladenosine tRNA methylthiotransferase MtaB